MSDQRQRHQHGVRKNLAEGIGGLVTGAAVVMLLRGLAKARGNRNRQAVPDNERTTTGDSA
ncbi:carbon monoxide dehydrogenase [Marichromatium bheemlicum]|uniref:Carbon monoxide dehydrogenase n=1 Tax=Marichromatium bheemlicum TaxID=365339 RepID=A0ABX1I4W8_9GAMM|nr:carbon monoxide dehydrogenase [Marichromatium bheemlicum]NKN31954.1 carbon monoxide dehydrogenase [Marichromatium bheemlicum]